jgi:hypothetical protein
MEFRVYLSMLKAGSEQAVEKPVWHEGSFIKTTGVLIVHRGF